MDRGSEQARIGIAVLALMGVLSGAAAGATLAGWLAWYGPIREVPALPTDGELATLLQPAFPDCDVLVDEAGGNAGLYGSDTSWDELGYGYVTATLRPGTCGSSPPRAWTQVSAESGGGGAWRVPGHLIVSRGEDYVTVWRDAPGYRSAIGLGCLAGAGIAGVLLVPVMLFRGACGRLLAVVHAGHSAAVLPQALLVPYSIHSEWHLVQTPLWWTWYGLFVFPMVISGVTAAVVIAVRTAVPRPTGRLP